METCWSFTSWLTVGTLILNCIQAASLLFIGCICGAVIDFSSGCHCVLCVYARHVCVPSVM